MKVEHIILKGIKQIKNFGAFPYSYKELGNSPRIIPISYGNTINNTKRVVREYVYNYIAKESLRDDDYHILDLDLVSCYTSILLGLCPSELHHIAQAIETIGLWNYIENEFKRNNMGPLFNKSAVKVYVYSSVFQGGNTAMIEGIMDNFRKNAGMTPAEFRECNDYEGFHTIARNVTRAMQDSSVVTDLRNVSSTLLNLYENEELVGPTGHKFNVDKHTFKTALPNYLQSFEFALLADATLKTKEKFPDMELLGHFHDGNVIAVPTNQMSSIIECFEQTLCNTGIGLGLKYKQKLEVKNLYPNDQFDYKRINEGTHDVHKDLKKMNHIWIKKIQIKRKMQIQMEIQIQIRNC